MNKEQAYDETDSIRALTVVLERDIPIYDAGPLITAMHMLRGVLSVTPHVSNHDAYVADERARREFGQKLLDVLYPKTEK